MRGTAVSIVNSACKAPGRFDDDMRPVPRAIATLNAIQSRPRRVRIFADSFFGQVECAAVDIGREGPRTDGPSDGSLHDLWQTGDEGVFLGWRGNTRGKKMSRRIANSKSGPPGLGLSRDLCPTVAVRGDTDREIVRNVQPHHTTTTAQSHRLSSLFNAVPSIRSCRPLTSFLPVRTQTSPHTTPHHTKLSIKIPGETRLAEALESLQALSRTMDERR
jgi:hypothetical protein